MNRKINGLGSKEVDDVSLGPIEKINSRPNGSLTFSIDLYRSISVLTIVWEINSSINLLT